MGCDVPSHSYAFSFESNAEWDGFYAKGAQIQKYFLDFCEKYDLRQFMRLETTVVGAVWLEEEGECAWLERIVFVFWEERFSVDSGEKGS